MKTTKTTILCRWKKLSCFQVTTGTSAYRETGT